MAELCKRIRSLTKDEQSRLFRKYFAHCTEVDSIVENAFSFFSKKAGNAYLYDSLFDEQIDAILDYVDNCDSEHWMYLLVYLDGLFSVEKNFEHFCSKNRGDMQNVYYFHSLFENDLGLLLPNFKSKWLKKKAHTPSELNEDPISVLSEYLWIDKTNDWTVTNVYSPDWNWNDNNPYTIVCSPLSKVCPFEYSTHELPEQNTFYITEYIDEEQRKMITRIEETLSYANRKNAGIVLFPELMISLETQSACSDIIKKHWEYKYPRLVCLPSCEYNVGNEWFNRTRILNDSGEIVLVYNKQQAFQYEKNGVKYFEPIKSDHKINIIHIKGLGRVGLVICADIFNTEIQEILYEKYKVDLLLVMSYTSGTDRFFREMETAKKYSCDLVWCNSCSAYAEDSTDKCIVVYFSSGHKDCEFNKIQKCNKVVCSGCAISIVLSPKHNGIGKIEQDFYN